MNINNLNALQIYIQENAPMFLTNDLTLYAIIGKIVSYTNELIDRENQLNNILNKLQSDTNTKLSDLTTTLNNFIAETNNTYNSFVSSINADIEQFKTNVNSSVNTFTTEQLARINSFINNSTTELNNYKTSVNNQISALNETINNTIQSKTSEVDTALANLNVSQEIEDYFNTLIDDDYFTNLFNSRFGNVYNIMYYQSTQPEVTNNSYFYNTSTNTLYFGVNESWEEVALDTSSLYLVNNSIYIATNVSGTLKLVQGGYNE